VVVLLLLRTQDGLLLYPFSILMMNFRATSSQLVFTARAGLRRLPTRLSLQLFAVGYIGYCADILLLLYLVGLALRPRRGEQCIQRRFQTATATDWEYTCHQLFWPYSVPGMASTRHRRDITTRGRSLLLEIDSAMVWHRIGPRRRFTRHPFNAHVEHSTGRVWPSTPSVPTTPWCPS
jgi:hypothetical protein